MTFYGTSLIKKDGTVQMMLVMEKCKGNLKSHISEHPESVPGRSRDPAVVTEVCRWLKEITDALTYIHEQDIIHSDLKLENILVRRITSFFKGVVSPLVVYTLKILNEIFVSVKTPK